jgi:hypothetical protein
MILEKQDRELIEILEKDINFIRNNEQLQADSPGRQQFSF